MLRSLAATLGAGAVASLAVPTAHATPLPQARTTAPSVRVSVESMSPRDLTGTNDHRVVSFAGHLTNTSSVPLTSLRLRIDRGPVITTRSELHQTDDANPAFPVIRSCQWQHPALPHGGSPALPPGASIAFTYHCDVDALDMTLIGIYPLVLQVQAGTTALPGHRPAGEVLTYLPSFPQGVTARTQVSWLWPLVDRPHRLANASEFLDDDLGRSVSSGGRLDRMLSLAEHAPKGAQLTLVIDPALVDALSQMEHGYQVRSGSHWVPGRSGTAATRWLDRLKDLTGRYPMVALPYGDPDVVAANRAGLADLARITPADRALIEDRLGMTPITTLAWPPGGAVTPEALTMMVHQGAQAVVLDPATLPGLPVTGPTPSSVARLHLPGPTPAVALVPDAAVSATVSGSADYPEGPRLAEQRYLAELAMITAETPSKGRELIVAPPQRWDPDPVSAAGMLADTTTMSWLAPKSATALAQHLPDVDRGPLVYPAAARQAELPQKLVASLSQIRAEVNDFRSALPNRQTADQVVTPYDQAVRRALSSAWRGDKNAPGYVADLRSGVATLRSGVHIVKPSGSGVYVLASSNSPLILTVANDLPEAIHFRIRITSRGTPGFTVSDIGDQVVQGSTRRTIQIPAKVERSGLFVVNALVTTPAGRPLGVDGQPVRLKVRSTAYGLIGLAITGLALALLLLLIIRRLVIQIRRHGGTGRPASGGSAPDPSERGRPDQGIAETNGHREDPIAEVTLDTRLGADPACIPAPAERSSV